MAKPRCSCDAIPRYARRFCRFCRFARLYLCKLCEKIEALEDKVHDFIFSCVIFLGSCFGRDCHPSILFVCFSGGKIKLLRHLIQELYGSGNLGVACLMSLRWRK